MVTRWTEAGVHMYSKSNELRTKMGPGGARNRMRVTTVDAWDIYHAIEKDVRKYFQL